MASREIKFDLPMALRILEISMAEYEERAKKRPSSWCIKTNLDKIHGALTTNLSRYYGIDYESLDFDHGHPNNIRKRSIQEVLAKIEPSFVIGLIPEPSPRSRPKCKYNLTRQHTISYPLLPLLSRSSVSAYAHPRFHSLTSSTVQTRMVRKDYLP